MRSFLAVFASLVLYASAIGQTDCLFSTDIQVTTAYWGAEISWNIVDLDGNVLIEGGEYGDNSEYQRNGHRIGLIESKGVECALNNRWLRYGTHDGKG